MMKIGVYKAIIVGLIICIALSSGCAKLPNEEKTPGSVSSVPGSTSSVSDKNSETDEGIEQVTYSTPIQTPTEEDKPEFSSPPDEENTGPGYSVIYSKKEYLRYNVIPFELDLKYPPLIFEYELEVDSIQDVKEGVSQFGQKEEYSYKRTLPNPSAWYSISIYDSDTSELIDSKELRQFADTEISGDFKVFYAGNYHIEISGNMVTANTTIFVPPENLE